MLYTYTHRSTSTCVHTGIKSFTRSGRSLQSLLSCVCIFYCCCCCCCLPVVPHPFFTGLCFASFYFANQHTRNFRTQQPQTVRLCLSSAPFRPKVGQRTIFYHFIIKLSTDPNALCIKVAHTRTRTQLHTLQCCPSLTAPSRHIHLPVDGVR